MKEREENEGRRYSTRRDLLSILLVLFLTLPIIFILFFLPLSLSFSPKNASSLFLSFSLCSVPDTRKVLSKTVLC